MSNNYSIVANCVSAMFLLLGARELMQIVESLSRAIIALGPAVAISSGVAMVVAGMLTFRGEESEYWRIVSVVFCVALLVTVPATVASYTNVA